MKAPSPPRSGAALVLAALAGLLVAASDVVLGPPPLRLIETVSPQGVQDVVPGSVISRAVIGRPDSALLGDPVILDWKGEKRRFERGDFLRAASVPDLDGIADAIFCEEEQKGSLGKAMTGQMLFGVVGALRGTKLDTRYCLFDSDGDDKFDHGFLLGAKGKEGHAPFAIPPARYALVQGIPLGGDSLVRLRYAGPAGGTNSIAFDLEVSGFGQMRSIPDPRVTVSLAKLPVSVVIAGAVVTILSYDPRNSEAKLRMDRDLAPGHIVLPELSRAYTDGVVRR